MSDRLFSKLQIDPEPSKRSKKKADRLFGKLPIELEPSKKSKKKGKGKKMGTGKQITEIKGKSESFYDRLKALRPYMEDESSDSDDDHKPAVYEEDDHEFTVDDFTFVNGTLDKKSRIAFEKSNQEAYIMNARFFSGNQYVGPEASDIYYVCPNAVKHSKELSHGYSWVALNVADTIYVAISGDPTRERPAGKIQLPAHPTLLLIISNMLEGKYQEKLPKSRKKIPFAVVFIADSSPSKAGSSSSGTRKEAKAANHSYVSQFLQKKLSSGLTSQKTQQITIRALSLVLGHDFKPDTIHVCGWGNLEGHVWVDGSVSIMPEEDVLEAIRSHSERDSEEMT